jgi:hypothetical protein
MYSCKKYTLVSFAGTALPGGRERKQNETCSCHRTSDSFLAFRLKIPVANNKISIPCFIQPVE